MGVGIGMSLGVSTYRDPKGASDPLELGYESSELQSVGAGH